MNIKFNKGMSLIELMVALSLGVVISLFLINIMANSNRTAINGEGSSEATENGRFIASWLTDRFRIAGYNSSGKGLEQGFASICTANILPPADKANCSFNGNNDNIPGSDRVAIIRTLNPFAPDQIYSRACDGTDLSSSGEIEVTDIYWINSTVNSSSGTTDDFDDILFCSTYNNATGKQITPSQAIANGIEALHVLYLEDTRDNGNESAKTEDGLFYRAASDVSDWKKVVGIKFSILTRSFNDSTQAAGQRSYILLDAAPYTFSDQVVRNIQQAVVYPANIDK